MAIASVPVVDYFALYLLKFVVVLTLQAGIVGMANSGRKNTNTSQFYFTLAPAPKCDGLQVIFGRVVEGLDILQRIGGPLFHWQAIFSCTHQILRHCTSCGVLLFSTLKVNTR